MITANQSAPVLNNSQSPHTFSRRQFFGQAGGVAATAVLPIAAATPAGAAAFVPLSAAAFATALHTKFSALALGEAQGTNATLTLESVEAWPNKTNQSATVKPTAFSLKFSASTPNLSQATYALTHPSLGTIPMLLVPSPNGAFMCAEYNQI